jgi:uncharacterized lipoprotein YmbA
MNGRSLRFTLAWLTSVCVGCTSVPVHYYTLTPPLDESLPDSQTIPAIDVRVDHMPPQLNRSELMVRTGATEMTLLDNERWASPVSAEIRDALRLELQRRLGRITGLLPALTKLTLELDVQHFDAELGQYARFEASWRAILSDAGQPSVGARPATCGFRADEQVHAGYAGIVEGYQREITALADAIVIGLTSPTSGVDVSCHKSTQDH